jgi:hypothetical protein
VPAFSLRALGTPLDDPIRFNQGLNESWVKWFVIVWNHLIPRKMRKSVCFSTKRWGLDF